MKKLLLFMISCLIGFCSYSAAQQATLEIMPAKTTDVGTVVNDISSGWHVREQYRSKSSGLSLGDQFASGVMTRDTILDYSAYILKFLSQLALLAWAAMIIFFGYKNAIWKWTMSTLWHVILWILVVIFSYVIIRTIWYMFIA